MKPTIEEYSGRLIKKILASPSQQEVRFCIDMAIEGMNAAGNDSIFIDSFIGKMILLLDECNPLFNSAEQWSNIKMARIQFNKLKRNRRFFVSGE